MKKIKKYGISILLLFLCGNLSGADTIITDQKRSLPGYPVKLSYQPSAQENVIRFSTTVPKEMATMIVGTMTVTQSIFADGINYSSIPSNTAGGRKYMWLQIVDSDDFVHWDKFSVGISTNTSPYLTQKDALSPDNPIAYQGPVYLMGRSSFTVTGFIVFDRPVQ